MVTANELKRTCKWNDKYYGEIGMYKIRMSWDENPEIDVNFLIDAELNSNGYAWSAAIIKEDSGDLFLHCVLEHSDGTMFEDMSIRVVLDAAIDKVVEVRNEIDEENKREKERFYTRDKKFKRDRIRIKNDYSQIYGELND